MSVFATDRDRDVHVARVYLQQARSFRLRGSPFAATLLEWAGNARRRAQGIAPPEIDRSLFGPWWRTPKGIVIKYDQCGYNGVQCFSTPIGYAGKKRDQYVWNPFVIDFEKVPVFLGRCEYLGKEMPKAAVDAQVRRLTGEEHEPRREVLIRPEQVRHDLPIQGELFA